MRIVKVALCICICTLFFSACSHKNPEPLAPANFYYCNRTVSYNTPDGVISPEIRETSGFENDIRKYMDAYLCGPVSDELYMIIPDNTILLSVQIQGTSVQLDFSKELANLSGIELTNASVCLIKSLHEFAGVETVTLTAEDSLLDERESFTLSLEDIVTMDTVTVEE